MIGLFGGSGAWMRAPTPSLEHGLRRLSNIFSGYLHSIERLYCCVATPYRAAIVSDARSRMS